MLALFMTTRPPKSIQDNLRFLCVEVDSQLASFEQFLQTPTPAIVHRLLDRRGYAYNLKMRIHNDCMKRLSAKKHRRSSLPQMLRSIELIATDLERLTELTRDCIRQLQEIDDLAGLEPQALRAMVKSIRSGIQLVEPAIGENDTPLALRLGQLQNGLEEAYRQRLASYVAALKKKDNTEELTRGLFVAHAIRQMAATLMHISEVIISANLGQPVNFERYHSLQSLIDDIDTPDEALRIEPLAETRSGSAISGIRSPNDQNNGYVAIFKDGVKRKVKEERQGVESWHEIYPGLAPKILSYQKRGQSAALLIEHLPGLTFEHLLLNESSDLVDEAVTYLTRTLRSVWQETFTPKSVAARHMQQLQKRLDDVYKIHPEFHRGDLRLCGVDLPAFDTLVEQAKAREASLVAPFAVYIHGDFNVDNIIYDPLEKRINFIDLHRSSYMDYVQDISVFMVSNYRLQIMDAPLRQRIMRVAMEIYRVARRHANRQQDTTFELRLALGLARSFATSTRFILDKSLARSMFLRARFLIEMVLAADIGKADKFRIPLKEIFVD